MSYYIIKLKTKSDEIKKMKGDITFIIIAHRDTTVKQCNKIFKLKNGKVSKIKYNNSNNLLNN